MKIECPKNDNEAIEKAKEFRQKIEEKKSKGFKHSGYIEEQLSEILYLQQGGEEKKAEQMLRKLLNMKELNSYYKKNNKNFEKTVSFLHIYDKARLFYERKKDFKNSCIYAGMTIFARIIDLKIIDLYDGINDVDSKYTNQLEKQLKKIDSENLYSIFIQTIETYSELSTIDNREDLLLQLDAFLG